MFFAYWTTRVSLRRAIVAPTEVTENEGVVYASCWEDVQESGKSRWSVILLALTAEAEQGSIQRT